MIPKTIHYCWFGNNPIPNNIKKYIKTWEKYCPDYKIIRWDESNFDVNCNDFVKKAYKEKCWAFVSDYARLKIIYDNGGIYLDTDVELVKSFDSLLENNAYFGVQQIDGKVATGLGFGAVKGAQIIKEMMEIYEKKEFVFNKRNSLACPILNTEVLEKHGFKKTDNILKLESINTNIYPPKYFDPISPGNTKYLMCDETYSIHRYTASWTSNKKRLKRKISNIIGQRRINAIKKFLFWRQNERN